SALSVADSAMAAMRVATRLSRGELVGAGEEDSVMRPIVGRLDVTTAAPCTLRLVVPPHAESCPHRGELRSGKPSEGTSSTGRASVSKTAGWGFKSLVPCNAWHVRSRKDQLQLA